MHQYREFAGGAAFADYIRSGEVLGIELLAPCKVSIMDRVAANEPADVKRRPKRDLTDVLLRAMTGA